MAGRTHKLKRGRRHTKTRRLKTRRRKGGVGTPDGNGPIGRMPDEILSLVAEHTPTRALARFAQTSIGHRAAAARELRRRRPAWLDTEAPVPLDATIEIGIVPNFESFELTHQDAVDILEENDDEEMSPQDLQAMARDGRWAEACRNNLLDSRPIPVRTVPFGRMYRAARHARADRESAVQVAQMFLEKYRVGDPCSDVVAINRPRHDEVACRCSAGTQLWPAEMWALRRTVEIYGTPVGHLRSYILETLGWPDSEPDPDFADFDALYGVMLEGWEEPIDPLHGLVNLG
jgi:hypothetical protein